MAYSPTYLVEGADATTNHASVSTASASPTADALVVLSGTYREGTNQTCTASSAFSVTGAGWTIFEAGYEASVSVESYIAFAIATSSPGSGAATCTYSTGADRSALHLMEVTSGWDTGDALNEATDTYSSGTTDNLNISAGSDTAGVLYISFVGSRGATANAPGDGETTVRETDSTGTSSSLISTQYKVGDGAHIFSTTRGGGSANHSGGIIEVNDAAAAGPAKRSFGMVIGNFFISFVAGSGTLFVPHVGRFTVPERGLLRR